MVVAGGPLAAWLVLLRTAAGDERRDALDVLALTWPTTAVAAGVALLAWAPRPAWVGVGVAVAALALVAPDLHRTPPPLPDTTQSGYLCTWLHAAGPTADAAVAARLARSDDPLLRRIAPALLTDPHADVAAARRCEFLLRYGRS
ncbi:hypothetical protein ACFQV2_05165 [Actinokineospora soli]|uniref:HEAT repeat domain-containing protein n=1 Tax=Actinokineospora soli TaxID=1048753 RepID=A0ABW2TH81_9PSEU